MADLVASKPHLSPGGQAMSDLMWEQQLWPQGRTSLEKF